MAQSAPPPASASSSDELRVVLFGLPAAGKSSLLGALGLAAQSQQHLLGGKLEDRSAGLAELGRQLHEGTIRRTADEVLSYPVHYQPFAADGNASASALEAILLDCDGRIASDLLKQRQSLNDAPPEGTLAFEVGDADAVLLILDASVPARQMEDDFAEFRRFLKAFQATRGARAEVAGLPVYLVLTKCDLLAQPGDTAMTWLERIEQRKREVGERFREFLASSPRPPLENQQKSPPSTLPIRSSTDALETATPFGKIQLHIWATAIKKPTLAGAAARPREPFGVAELFRQALQDAALYRARHERSQKRLARLVIASLLLIGVMLLLTVALFVVNANSRVSLLEARVEDFRFLDRGGPAERLKGSPEQLIEKQKRLEDIREDPLFRRLSSSSRLFVDERIEELKEYIPYLERVLTGPPLSREQTEEGLERRIEQLRDQLSPPRPEWTDTPANLARQEKLEEAEALRKAVLALRNWYLDGSDQAGRLWTFDDYIVPGSFDWADWASKVEKLLDSRKRPPFPEEDPLPGIRGGLLSFRHAFRFDRVLDARARWDSDRARLIRVLNIACALGLAPGTAAQPPVLVIPRDLTLQGCRERLAILQRTYPDYDKTFVREDLPEFILPRIRQAAQRQYDLLLEPARAEVLRQLRSAGTGREETRQRWQAVQTWLRHPQELVSWRELARVLLRLQQPSLPDPVQTLAAFLDKGQFTLEIRSLTLEIPELRGLKPKPEARLVVLHPAGMRQPALAFEPSGEPVRDAARRLVAQTYRLVEGQKIVYRPGEQLWVELPIRGNTERLVWSQSRSSLYQFESLLSPPRLQSVKATSLHEGRLLDDIKLVVRPEEGVPPLPDLLPLVKLD